MLERSNDHPYIIAYGLSMEEIVAYYVEVEKHLFPVSVKNNSFHEWNLKFIIFL